MFYQFLSNSLAEKKTYVLKLKPSWHWTLVFILKKSIVYNIKSLHYLVINVFIKLFVFLTLSGIYFPNLLNFNYLKK